MVTKIKDGKIAKLTVPTEPNLTESEPAGFTWANPATDRRLAVA
jgi:hypothetical protein